MNINTDFLFEVKNQVTLKLKPWPTIRRIEKKLRKLNLSNIEVKKFN